MAAATASSLKAVTQCVSAQPAKQSKAGLQARPASLRVPATVRLHPWLCLQGLP
jgi:hypothetical protein